MVMADEEQEENWPEFFENNRLIPVHPSRRKSGSQSKPNAPFRLLFKSVIGISLPQAIEASSQDVEFQLRLTLYDAANKCFFGSTWLGPYFPSSGKENGRHSVVCDEAVYFHSSLHDITCVGVVEVTGEVNGQSVACGWTLIRIFDRVSELSETTSRQSAPKSIHLYYGSPAALLCISETFIEESPSLLCIEECSLSFVLQIHPPLEKVFHLIPENAVMSGDDFVPGVLEPQADGSGFVDILKKPRLAKTTPSFINKLSIMLNPSVEEFEDELRQILNHDRLHKNNIIPDDGLQISIVERRLKVSVHNGWKFVSEPHIVYLEPEYEGGKSGRKTPSSQSSLRGKILSLVLRSRLELNELVHHPLFAIIFELEYVMSEPFTQPLIETKRKKPSLSGSLMRSQNQTVTLRWALWLPFEGGVRGERETTLEFTGGCQGFPSDRLVYTKTLPQLSGKKAPKSGGTLKFLFTQQRRRGSSMRSSAQGSQMLMVPASPGLPSPGPFDTAGGMFSSVGNISDGGHAGMPLTPGVVARPPLPPGNRMSDEFPAVPPRDPLFQQYTSSGMRPIAPTPVTYLSEVPHSTVHSPLILAGTGTSPASGPTTMTRAAYARLSSAGFPSIVDRHGNPPQVIDPKEELPLHLDTEGMDQLLGNEIIIQFLALSRCYNRTTFFSFQFYRFPQVTTERVYLKDTDSQSQGIPCVLQKFNKDGSLSDESPGLMLRYMVDPSYMQPGEGRVFSQYLLGQALHVDVWDGDSLLLIGSTTLQLKHLLRQGREAVIVAHELDVVSTELSEEGPTHAGDMTRTGTVRPFGIKSAVEAKLHVRVANIGHPSDGPKGKLGTVPKKHSTVVISETVRETGTTNVLAGNKTTKIKAKQMAECDAELAAVLFSRQEKIAKDDQPVREADAIRKRKLERMLAVRQIQGADNTTGNLIIQKEEKLQRTRDLKTIQLYREKLRHEKILCSLAGNITTSHTIYPSFGTAEFFEFVLRNPYSTEQTITIHCDDNELKVITDTREWRYFKRKTETRSALEENMFDTASTSPYPQVFLRPRETVHIPFKFQTFRADQSVPEQGPSHPLKQQTQTYLKTSTSEENNLKPRQVKVSFMNKDECPVAILTVQVEPRPHVIDRTFRFYHAEQSFLKKTIRLPPWRSLPGAPVMDENTQPQVHVRCSDLNAVCEARKMPSGEPQDVFLKIACGPSPSVKRFFVLLYIDYFLAEPCQTWQLYVHSLQRIDMSAVQGQSSRLSVILRGTQSSRLVQCFSSHPEELQVLPADPIMLMANAVHEVHLTLRPHTSGSTRYMYVNVVDVEFHQLVRTWLVCASCQMPVISKSFELQIQVGGGKGSNKRVSFANPYPTKRTFHLKCNRPDLLQFKESIIEVGPGESHSIGLRFTPQQFPGKSEVFIFINDSEDKNEETFSINAVYS
ncbi:Nephrocystin-4 [Desmophyllum pertusum]|uniref:Nephrocystin-4 n=1 Tax=Desmophyllum pertusum TaxID=174260 RepID=A0A9X0A7C8_9CNID|nr:Nephrocystin-4 [Desmophyllum pertusum]